MADNDGLSFDKAEFAAPPTSAACGTCGNAIVDYYYDMDGAVVCDRCRLDAQVAQNESGGGVSRFLRACVFGGAAALLCSLVWYAVIRFLNMELGLLGIVVGLVVGGAVRAGSRHRGGWLYQALAIALTYGSICSSYIPLILKEMKDSPSPTATTLAAGKTAAPATPGEPSAPASPSPAPTQAANASAVTDDKNPFGGLPAPIAILLAFVFLFAIACVAPFFGGLSNLMGIVIIGIALYEAWKINRKVVHEVRGPFKLGAPPPAPEQDVQPTP